MDLYDKIVAMKAGKAHERAVARIAACPPPSAVSAEVVEGLEAIVTSLGLAKADRESRNVMPDYHDGSLRARHRAVNFLEKHGRDLIYLTAAPKPAVDVEAVEFAVGDKVVKPRGYPFPGTIVAAFWVGDGQRFVVNNDLAPGMLHIFSPSQLALAALRPAEGGGK